MGDLSSWLERIEGLHPSEIDLGLERVGRVARALDVDRPDARVITVGGTNGKGSVCALLESMLSVAGHRVALYTSPHLVRFNERIRIDGHEADDGSICEAFDRVEAARGDTSLTYFEFGTLAALDLFARAGTDTWILEVGLGGRLDATNVIDADVAVVTSVGIDHVEWLGDDRDAVGREKAGIARAGRPLVVGDRSPPDGLLRSAAEIGAVLVCIGRDFEVSVDGDQWAWQGSGSRLPALPMPAMTGGYQLRNAGVALAALECAGLGVERAAVEQALQTVRVPGRFEVRSGPVETILDVAHNPDAAAMLAAALDARPCAGRTIAVIGMYADKDADAVVDHLADRVDAWCTTGLSGPRGRSADAMAEVVSRHGLLLWARDDDPQAAWRSAHARAADGDRIIVLGSFATVAAVAARCPDPGDT
jgi:dihydrofolate synthase/folylpolyglutamate synthase